MGRAAHIILLDDWRNMEFIVFVLFTKVGEQIVLGSSDANPEND